MFPRFHKDKNVLQFFVEFQIKNGFAAWVKSFFWGAKTSGVGGFRPFLKVFGRNAAARWEPKHSACPAFAGAFGYIRKINFEF